MYYSNEMNRYEIERADFMYRALTVAEHIIRRCNKLGRPISNLKLQKILYFVQAEFLVTTGYVCFQEEIEAWDFGPVVPVVYHRYKVYGSASIPYFLRGTAHGILESDVKIMDGIIDECAKYSAAKLVEITHNQTPWKKAYRSSNKVITPESMKQYFEEE